MKSLVLEGGFKGWTTAGFGYTELMNEYDVSVWTKLYSYPINFTTMAGSSSQSSWQFEEQRTKAFFQYM